MSNTTIPWVQWAARAWGDNWYLGRKTEKSIRRLSRWDASSQTYKPPRFVTKDEYHSERENYFSHVYKQQNAEIARLKDLLSISATAPLLEVIEELKKSLADKDVEIESLEQERDALQCKEGELDTKIDDIQDDLAWVLTYLYGNKPQEAILILERNGVSTY